MEQDNNNNNNNEKVDEEEESSYLDDPVVITFGCIIWVVMSLSLFSDTKNCRSATELFERLHEIAGFYTNEYEHQQPTSVGAVILNIIQYVLFSLFHGMVVALYGLLCLCAVGISFLLMEKLFHSLLYLKEKSSTLFMQKQQQQPPPPPKEEEEDKGGAPLSPNSMLRISLLSSSLLSSSSSRYNEKMDIMDGIL